MKVYEFNLKDTFKEMLFMFESETLNEVLIEAYKKESYYGYPQIKDINEIVRKVNGGAFENYDILENGRIRDLCIGAWKIINHMCDSFFYKHGFKYSITRDFI